MISGRMQNKRQELYQILVKGEERREWKADEETRRLLKIRQRRREIFRMFSRSFLWGVCRRVTGAWQENGRIF